VTIASTIDRGVYTIAELGCSHGGRADTAIAMIDAAHRAGVSATKTQRRDVDGMDPEILAAPYNGPHSFATDGTYRSHRLALELPWSEQEGLLAYARSLGIEHGCSVWDLLSAREVGGAGFDFVKIPSALATDLALLADVATYGMPVVVSWGACTDRDVREGTAALEGAEVYGLHATSAYPLRVEDAHLRCIPAMHAEYVAGRKWRAVGYSDHTSGIAISTAAVALGARVIERHLSLDRTSKGTDHAASLEPDGLHRVVRDCAAVLAAMGDAEKRVLGCEVGPMKKLRPRRAQR